jgi:hypothetical protein
VSGSPGRVSPGSLQGPPRFDIVVDPYGEMLRTREAAHDHVRALRSRGYENAVLELRADNDEWEEVRVA